MHDPYPHLQPGDLITSTLINRVISDLTSRTSDTGLLLGPLARDTRTLVALATGLETGGGIWLDGEQVFSGEPGSGLSLVIFNPALGQKYSRTYNTLTSPDESRLLATDLRTRAAEHDIIVAVSHEAYLANLDPTARTALGEVGGASLAAPSSGRHNAAFIGVVPALRTNTRFDYLVSVMPPDGSGAPTALAFVWGIYSRPLRRVLLGGGAGGAVLAASAPPPQLTLSSLVLSPKPATMGTIATGTVTARGNVPEGTQVTLTSSAPSVATVPASVNMPPGPDSRASFSITAIQGGTVTITATLAGASPVTDTLTVQVPTAPPATIKSLTLTPNAADRGVRVMGTITMSGQVTADTRVILLSSNPQLVPVPAEVVVPRGQDAQVFPINSSTEIPFTDAQDVTITASLAGSTPGVATLNVRPNDKDRGAAKERKDAKETKDQKEAADATEAKNRKDARDDKDSKDNADNQGRKNRKDNKDTKDSDDGPIKRGRREVIDGGRVLPEIAERFIPRAPLRAEIQAPEGGAFITGAERPPVGIRALDELEGTT